MLFLNRGSFLMLFDIIYAVPEFHFKLDTNVHLKVEELSQEWTSPSLVSCAIDCIRLFQTCSSITYNANTKLCTTGMWVFVNETFNDDIPRGQTYHIGSDCDYKQSFQFFRFYDVTTCLWLSPDKQNYTNARADCKGRGAHLYTVKSPQKLGALNITAYDESANFWIGLDDMELEDTFRWVDDQSELTPDLRKLIFRKGQPNNENNKEDCVLFNSTFALLNDDSCSKQNRFVCEKDMVCDDDAGLHQFKYD